MPPVTSKSAIYLSTSGKRAGSADAQDATVLTQYLRDIRAAPLLSHAQEQALGKHIQDSRQQWCQLLLDHLVHVPLLLAWWPRLRRGRIPLTTLCRSETLPTAGACQTALEELHRLAGQLRCAVQQQDTPQLQTVPALRATLRAVLHDWDWQLAFVQQAWRRFDTAMTRATVAQPPQRAASYVRTLGYSLTECDRLRRDLRHLSTLVEQAKHEMIRRNLRLVVSVAYKFKPRHDLLSTSASLS